MLQTMRNNMKLVLWITVIFFVLLIFLVWGADLQFGDQSAQPNIIGMVNGEPVSTTTYQQLLAYNRQNAQVEGRDLEPNDELIIQEKTWNAMIEDLLLKQEARRRGLEAQDAEVQAVILNSPPPIITRDPNFQNEQGQFDLGRFQAILRDPATPESFLLQLEAYVREYLPTMKLQEMVQISAKITEDELKRAYLAETEKARITHVLVDLRQCGGNVEVTDAGVEAYFQDHAEEYQQPRRADLVFVMIPRRATSADSMRLRQDLLDFAAQASEAEAARRAGRENLQASDFATLAQSFSDAPYAEEGGLSPDFLKASEMSPAQAARVKGLKPGEISTPFADGFFYHIVQLAEKKTEGAEPSYRVRDLGLRIGPSDSTIQVEEERLQEVRGEAQASGLRAAALAHGLTVREARDVLAGGIVPGLAVIPDIGAWANMNPAGTVSRVYAASNGWYLLEVAGITEAGVPPLSEVKDRVRVDCTKERRLEACRAQADRVLSRVRAGESLETAAQAESLRAVSTPEFTRSAGIPGVGRDPGLLAASFRLAPGEVSQPLETGRGWMILRVDARAPVDWGAFAARREELLRDRTNTEASQVMTAFLEDLRRKAKIVDYRS